MRIELMRSFVVLPLPDTRETTKSVFFDFKNLNFTSFAISFRALAFINPVPRKISSSVKLVEELRKNKRKILTFACDSNSFSRISSMSPNYYNKPDPLASAPIRPSYGIYPRPFGELWRLNGLRENFL